MKTIFLILMAVSTLITVNAQENELLMIPKIEDIKRIKVEKSDGNWFTPDSLLKLLPKFKPGGGYKTKMLWQHGTIKLKNGKVLKWRTYNRRTLVLFTRDKEKYFQIPNEGGNDITLQLPKPTDVAKIEISNTSANDWYKKEKLMELLPYFVAIEGTYVSKQPFQYGTFVLKNGEEIKWMAGGKDTILLYEDSREQLFRLSKSETICTDLSKNLTKSQD
jgi:hypothetical protein